MSDSTEPDQEAMDEWSEFVQDFAEEHGASTLFYAVSTTKIAFDEEVREQYRDFAGGSSDSSDFKIDDDLF